MSNLPRSQTFRRLLTPWKHPTPWSRFIGTFCLAVVTIESVTLILGIQLPDAIWFGTMTCLIVIASADLIRMHIEGRRFKRDRTTLHLWSQVIQGDVKLDDLPPEQQEAIAVMRAQTYVERRDL